MPVLEALAGEVPVSIDTAKAEVARRALALGAELVNDVTALRGDPELAGVVADSGAYLCLMHMQGEPRTMQADPRYDDVVDDVAAFLEERLRVRRREPASGRVARLPRSRHRLRQDRRAQLRARPAARRAGRAGPPGASSASRARARWGRSSATRDATTGPLAASLAAAVAAYERGAAIIRAHDVREHVEALQRSRGGARVTFTVELHGLRVLRPARRPRRTSARDRRRSSTTSPSTSRDAALSDRIEDAVDYRDVAQCVRDVSDGRAYHLIEALAAAVADAIVARFPVEWVACACASRTSSWPACSSASRSPSCERR